MLIASVAALRSALCVPHTLESVEHDRLLIAGASWAGCRVTKKTKASARSVSDVDVYIGLRMKHLRLQLGLTQAGLAEKLGISFQQLQKYEQGRNRVSAARLFDICDFFGVTLASMFERKIKV